jgi:SAM-dependent methyltransferase
VFNSGQFQSLLDVGCGRGFWIAAARDLGMTDVLGIDGVAIPPDQLLFPARLFMHSDLERPLDLGRRFDIALCLEVAEHLDPSAGRTLVQSLATHSDVILFSAAIPGQPGQHHIHCRWPEYWQELFNAEGYRCDDWIRWVLWRDDAVEPWYRQNIFMAYRDEQGARGESRILAVVHPEMLVHLHGPALDQGHREWRRGLENGQLALSDYAKIAFLGPLRKVMRTLTRGRSGA